MFSPTRSLPSESDSDEEDDLDLPIVDIGTPKKLKIESNSEQTQPPTISTSNNRFHCIASSSSTDTSKDPASFRPPSPSNLPAANHDLQRQQFKETQDAFRVMKKNLECLSPVKDVHRETVSNDSKKTALKVRKLSKNLMEKTDRERKLEDFRSRKGIQGIAKSEEALSSKVSESTDVNSVSDTGSPHQALLQRESHSSSIGGDNGLLGHTLLANPGKLIFVERPSLITELYPPGIDVPNESLLGNALTQGSEEDLRNIICSQVLCIAYISKPCPVELYQWLFQLMALSDDPRVSSGAYKSLCSLLQQVIRQKSFCFSIPSVADITDALVSLGAEREKLRPQVTDSGTEVHVMLDHDHEEVFPPASPPQTNLYNLIAYISVCVQTVADYTVQQLEELILILSSLALDRYCMHFLRRSIQVCIHHLLAAYPDTIWPEAVRRLSPQLACLSPHHHDNVVLARVITGTRSRERCLVRDFCRLWLLQMSRLSSDASQSETDEKMSNSNSIINGGAKHDTNNTDSIKKDMEKKDRLQNIPHTTSTSDCAFLKLVLESYHKNMPEKMTYHNYYELHSFFDFLQLYSPISELVFPSPATKQDFIYLLGLFRSAIREDPLLPLTSIVKDVLIHMKLELQEHKGGRKQMDLFSFAS